MPTGLAVAIPEGYAGLVVPRSGHALRSGIGVVNGPGLIDSGYRGEIKVILVNHGHETVRFETGDRIWVLPGLYQVELSERVGDPILVWATVDTLAGTVNSIHAGTEP